MYVTIRAALRVRLAEMQIRETLVRIVVRHWAIKHGFLERRTGEWDVDNWACKADHLPRLILPSEVSAQ